MSGSDFLEGQFWKKSFKKIKNKYKKCSNKKIFADSEWTGPIWHKTFEKGKKLKKIFLHKSILGSRIFRNIRI